MKRGCLFLLAFLLWTAVGLYAQPVVLVNESFDNATCSFSAYRGGWNLDSNYHVSGKYAYLGFVPTQPGDSVELVSNWFDCENYSHVLLQFSQICKISANDMATVEFQIDRLGAKWTKIPMDAYRGARTPYKQTKFSHMSYQDWLPGDSLAIPTNSWWKTETFDLSADVAWERVRFKFKIKRGTVMGSQFAYGWLIDDFTLIGAQSEIKPPVVEFVSIFADTVYNTGPFVFKAKVATRTITPIIRPYLHLKITYNNVTTHDSILMTSYEGDSMWTATLSQHLFGTNVEYYIDGRDSSGNSTHAGGAFYLKRLGGGGVNGYVMIGQGNYTSYVAPPFAYYNPYMWSREIYMADEFSPQETGGRIETIAYNQANSSGDVITNLKCYMKAIPNAVLGTSYADPVKDGATLVWQGSYPISSQGWHDFMLSTPFVLPPNHNLLVYWECRHGSYASAPYFYGTYFNVARCIYNDGWNSFPTSGGYTTNVRSDIRVLLRPLGTDDSNSVAMHAIDSPLPGAANGSVQVVVTIKNVGVKNLTSAQLGWSVNGVPQTPVTWKGNLPSDFNDTVTLGSYLQSLDKYDTVLVWVNTPNNSYDSTTYDDTLSVMTFGCASPFAGKYVIGSGKGADFATMEDAFEKLSICGSKGTVRFLLQSGDYKHLTVEDLSKVMGNDTLIIGSLAGHRDSVRFWGGDRSDLVVFDNAHNVVLENVSLLFDYDSWMTQRGIFFQGDVSNIEVRHCYLQMDTNSGSNGYGVYRPNGSPSNDLRFIGNEFYGGGYAFYLMGGNGSSAFGQRMVFDSNYVHGQSNGFYTLEYCDFSSFSHNVFIGFCPEGSYNYYYSEAYFVNFSLFNGNKYDYYDFDGGSYYGEFYQINTNNTSSRALFCNNEFIGDKQEGYGGGVMVYMDNSNVDFYNNSVLVRNGQGLNVYGYGTATVNINNNIFASSGVEGYAINIGNLGGGVGTVDYNLYYAKDFVGSCGGREPQTLADWQQLTGQDWHSLYSKPIFFNLPDLDTLYDSPKLYDRSWKHQLNLAIYSGLDCPVPTGVTMDILGKPRTGNSVMGCYCADPMGLDAAISGQSGLASSVLKGTTSTVSAVLTNMGKANLTSAQIGWSSNGVAQQGKSWTGNLATYASDTVLLGNVVTTTWDNQIKIWVSNPNNALDSNHRNDTLLFNYVGCDSMYKGSYLVGSNGRFASLGEAMESISICGLDGPVTLLVQKGSYDGFSLKGKNIPGMSAANSITITSATGKSEDVTLTATSGYVVTLAGANHFRFKNLTIDGKAATGAVNIAGSCNDLRFESCVMKASTANDRYVFYKTSGFVCDSVFLLKNQFIGGYYGLYFYCSGTGANGYNTHIYIDSNQLLNAWYYGYYFYYTDLNSFSHNIIKTNSSNGYFYNYFYYTNHYNTVCNTWDFTEASLQSCYNYFNYPHRYNYSGTDGYICNNEFIMSLQTNDGYCMRMNYPGETQHIYHNSIYFPGQNGYGFYGQFSSSGNNAAVDIANNLIWADNYPLYINGTAVAVTSDYNDLYSKSGRIGYWQGTSCASLSDWQNASSDVTSVSSQPLFLAPEAAGLELLNNSGLTCPSLSGVSDDITGYSRKSPTTMGAYEYNPKGNDLNVIAITKPKIGVALQKGDTVQVCLLVNNLGKNTATSFKVDWTVNNVRQTTYNWTGSLAFSANDTVCIGSFVAISGVNRIKVWTSQPNNMADERPSNDTASVSVTGCVSVFSGTFTIGKNGNFKDFAEFVDIVADCGLGGPVVLKVMNGYYDAMIFDKPVNGTSSRNTITITSKSNPVIC